jgi:hypothetical protein
VAGLNGVAARPGVDQPAKDQPGPAEPAAVPAESGSTAALGEPPLDTEFDSAPAPPGDKPPPEQLGDDRGEDRRRRSRTGLLVALVAVILAVALIAALANLLPGRESVAPTGNPIPSTSATAASTPSQDPTPEPTPSESVGALPVGAVDCSELGADVYCMLEPECWGSVQRYGGPRRATPADCYEEHLYQTYAVGLLGFVPTKQETLDAVPEVRKACRAAVANSMLSEAEQRDDWEVYSLGPQEDDEFFFRCIFGRGIRDTPFLLKKP